MKEFYYQLKIKEDYGWSYYPTLRGLVQAEDIKKARKHVKEDILDNDCKRDNGLLLTLIEIKENNKYLIDLCGIHICEECGKEYTLNETLKPYGKFCSDDCKTDFDRKWRLENDINYVCNVDNPYPVIYLIENISNGKNYVGQTIRSFTLRWWEHYHNWIKHQDEDITNFRFTILEEIVRKDKGFEQIKQELQEKEQFYIEKYNALESGYNSVNAKAKK